MSAAGLLLPAGSCCCWVSWVLSRQLLLVCVLEQVVLLGLYNGQRLESEPAADLVSYSRVTEVGGSAASWLSGGWWRGRLARCARPAQ